MPISVGQKLCDKHNITWVRNLMLYYKYKNVGKKFSLDLAGKVVGGIFDKDSRDMKCNCNAKTLMMDGSCIYDKNATEACTL